MGFGIWHTMKIGASKTVHKPVWNVLGHTQRGGSPIPQDRLFASAFGVHIVDMVAERKFDRMVTWSNRDCIDVPLADVVDQPHTVDPDGPVVRTARGLASS